MKMMLGAAVVAALGMAAPTMGVLVVSKPTSPFPWNVGTEFNPSSTQGTSANGFFPSVSPAGGTYALESMFVNAILLYATMMEQVPDVIGYVHNGVTYPFPNGDADVWFLRRYAVGESVGPGGASGGGTLSWALPNQAWSRTYRVRTGPNPEDTLLQSLPSQMTIGFMQFSFVSGGYNYSWADIRWRATPGRGNWEITRWGYETTPDMPARIPPVSGCPSDLNGDRDTNAGDLSVLLSQFGMSVTPGTGADSNGDGVVNSADLSSLLAWFGCDEVVPW